jgi:hypothetical protein
MVGGVPDIGALLVSALAFPLFIAGILRTSAGIARRLGLPGIVTASYATLYVLALGLLPLLLIASLIGTIAYGFVACWLIAYFYMVANVDSGIPMRRLAFTATFIGALSTIGLLLLGVLLYKPLAGVAQ